MTKKDLIDIVAEHADLSKAAAGRAVQAFMGEITGRLARGETVSIKGFGTFCVTERVAKKGCNPQTGEAMIIPARTVAKFRPARKLAEAIAHSESLRSVEGTLTGWSSQHDEKAYRDL